MNGFGLCGVSNRYGSLSAMRCFLPSLSRVPFGVRGKKDRAIDNTNSLVLSRANEVGDRALVEFGAAALEIADNVYRLQVYSYRGSLSSSPDRVIRTFERAGLQFGPSDTTRAVESALPSPEVDEGSKGQNVLMQGKSKAAMARNASFLVMSCGAAVYLNQFPCMSSSNALLMDCDSPASFWFP